jgi:DNA-binding NarL/FixJ family response regulator
VRTRAEEWDDAGMARTVLVVDDHADFRASARSLLEAEGFDVVGAVADGAQALEAAQRLHPSVVLLDIRLPDVDGLTVAERLAGLAHPPDVVLVSSRDASVYGARLRKASARGFLAKSDLSGSALRRLLAS